MTLLNMYISVCMLKAAYFVHASLASFVLDQCFYTLQYMYLRMCIQTPYEGGTCLVYSYHLMHTICTYMMLCVLTELSLYLLSVSL